MKKTITKIEATIKELPRRKRVAAYARVSRGTEHMLHSLAAQVKHYTKYIKANNEWDFAGIYADADETGTKDDRPEFQRLLADCRAGNIDLVLVKTISRFARNTVTLLATVRELADLGIEVYFEEQNIYSLSSDGELMLSILASYAQEESRSVSENVKWRMRNDMKNGKAKPRKAYGFNISESKLVIVPKEAEIVCLIYDLFFSGLGATAIANKLNDEGIPSPTGKRWTACVTYRILTNPKMCGDTLHQRNFSTDHISKRRVKNRGELPMFLIEDTHEGIVSKETFAAVKAELDRRAAVGGLRETVGLPFRKKIYCEACGRRHFRKPNVCSAEKYHEWMCLGRDKRTVKGKTPCRAHILRERTLMAASAKVLGLEEFDGEIFAKNVERIISHTDLRLTFVFHDGAEIVVAYEKRKRWKDVKIIAKTTKSNDNPC